MVGHSFLICPFTSPYCVVIPGGWVGHLLGGVSYLPTSRGEGEGEGHDKYLPGSGRTYLAGEGVERT